MKFVPLKVVLLRSIDMLPDPRVEKYISFFRRNEIEYQLLGWNRSLERQQKDNTLYFNYSAPFGSGVGNLGGLFRFNCFLLVQLVKDRSNFSTIHACDLDTIVPALIIKFLFGKKIIFDIFDWYSDSRVINNFLLKRIIMILERIAVKFSDKIIICDVGRKKQIPYKISEGRLIILPNVPQFSGNLSIANSKDSRYKLIISYVGILSTHRGLEDMLSVVSDCADIQFVIGGFGELEGLVRDYAVNHENIVYLGKLEYLRGLEIMNSSDLICAMYYRTVNNHIYAAPNKYYEALFLGKPILTTTGTIIGLKSVNEETGFAISEGKVHIREFLLKSLDREKLENFGRNGRKLWEHKYVNLWHNTIETDYKGAL